MMIGVISSYCDVCVCSDNSIGDDGARAISQALITNTTLTWLSLWSE